MKELPLSSKSGNIMTRPSGRKPDWLLIGKHKKAGLSEVGQVISSYHNVTVCKEAMCPNIGYCWNKGTATFMIGGKVCTRSCTFCAVSRGKPAPLLLDEPERVARAVFELQLKHVVVTSVARDDLDDGGAGHFVDTINAIRRLSPLCTTEVLIPDFQGNRTALFDVADAHPHVINHNLETIERLQSRVRPQASYFRSLNLLRDVKEAYSSVYTKSGIMVGLGETIAEVEELMRDLRESHCDIFTVGQYLKPPNRRLRMLEYVTPATFQHYKEFGESIGFKYVASGPFIRSSFNADEFFRDALQSSGV